MKGCAIFAGLFLLGVGLVVGGFAYDLAVAQNLETQGGPARVTELAGLVLMFGSVFGLAGWAFYRRLRDEKRARASELAQPHAEDRHDQP